MRFEHGDTPSREKYSLWERIGQVAGTTMGCVGEAVSYFGEGAACFVPHMGVEIGAELQDYRETRRAERHSQEHMWAQVESLIHQDTVE